MKKAAVIILLLSFAARPAYELGYLAYFELNIDYIIETYCVNKEKPELQCNGKCHLMNQLAMGKPQKKDDAKSVRLIEAFFPVYFQKADYIYEYSQFDYELKASTLWASLNKVKACSTKVPVPPPQV